MSIELTLPGNGCNLRCTYCYQNALRDAGRVNPSGEYDVDVIFAALEAEGVGQGDGQGGTTGFTLFGGEPLLTRLSDLEKILARARAKGVPVGIQTNATLLTERHFALFREHRVNVSVSMDGPGELNDARWAGTLEATRTQTARSQANLERVLREGLGTSLIVTLTRGNAAPDRLPRLVAWVEDLYRLGLRHLNLHLLEVDEPAAAELRLSVVEQVSALEAFAALRGRCPDLRIAPLEHFRLLLLGQDEQNVSCIWHACDPYTTDAVRGVNGEGVRGNCGRTNKEGVPWLKAEAGGHERQLALYLTPQEHGGCAGCRFFAFCKGECPGMGEHGEWRSRTEHCPTLMVMFEATEAQLAREGLEPLSLSLRRPLIEARLLEAWASGRNLSIAGALRGGGTGSGDRPHGDAPHGDIPHGDHTDVVNPVKTHGDHTDDAAQLSAT